MAEESYMDDDIQPEEEEDLNISRGDFNPEGNAAVMKNFFDMSTYIRKKIQFWRGFSYIDGKLIQTHEPLAPDSFIYSVIGVLDSMINQHNSVSYMSRVDAEQALAENVTAVNHFVLTIHPKLFDDEKYPVFIQEFDHMQQLFMGLVINGHGNRVATALQAGVVNELNMHQMQKKETFMERTKNFFNKKVE